MKPCQWRPSDSLKNHNYAGCPAFTVNGSSYCAAHLALIEGRVEPPTKIDRAAYRDADLLPLTDAEFRMLAELRERSK